ncbi:MAG: hypothetical protein HYS81_04485 [Candidatus Aenigmatarchaeota archaeon]|nr:MAG: hypothetical protein HYS81_04485 [Candidatus Aenigmarchaeota archaeon]
MSKQEKKAATVGEALTNWHEDFTHNFNPEDVPAGAEDLENAVLYIVTHAESEALKDNASILGALESEVRFFIMNMDNVDHKYAPVANRNVELLGRFYGRLVEELEKEPAIRDGRLEDVNHSIRIGRRWRG